MCQLTLSGKNTLLKRFPSEKMFFFVRRLRTRHFLNRTKAAMLENIFLLFFLKLSVFLHTTENPNAFRTRYN